jgi:virginiamycin B lyase
MAVVPDGPEYGVKFTLEGPDGTKAVFNDSTDPNFVGVLSPESSGLDSADVRESAADAVESDGGVHGDFYYGRRPVVLQGTISASSAAQRNERASKLKQASNAMREDATLKWTPAGGEEMELKVRRQQPVRITKGFVKEFQVPLVSASALIKSVKTNTTKLSITGGTLTKEFIDGGESEITDIVATSEFLYFIVKHKTIKRCKLDGTAMTTLATVEEGATGLVVGASKLMWTNIIKAKIGRCNLTGTEVENGWLTVEGQPDGICSDGTWLYWCDFLNGNIGRVKVGGTEQTNKFITGCKKPTGITTNSGFLYWVNMESKSIGVATTAGEFVNQEGVTGFPGLHGGIRVSGEFIYVVYLEGNIIMRLPKFGGTIETIICDASNQPTGFSIQGGFLYWVRFSSKWIGRASTAAKMSGKISSNGTATGGVKLKVPGPVSFITIKNATTGKELKLGEGYAITQGETLVVDTELHTITNNSGSVNYFWSYVFPSSWLELALGENTIETNTLCELEIIAPNARWV